ncbi:hypothetical protein BH10PSE7_BH10PSE7_03130 [soil metagenome]
MNNVLSLAAALVLAAGSAGFAATAANARTSVVINAGVPSGWGYGYRYPRAHFRNGPYIYYSGGYWYPHAYWLDAPRDRVQPVSRAMSPAHVSWCYNHRFRYSPASNTFLGRDGYRHVCAGPYA